jgi:hypothetical protein
MLDLLASKLKTVQLRAQAKDYRDVLGTLDAGLSLAEGLAAAVIYGKDFNGALSLKALTFFEDGDLPSLTRTVQKRLLEAANFGKLKRTPGCCGSSWSESAGSRMTTTLRISSESRNVLFGSRPPKRR